ncbi:MAG TPA: small basic protein, partial [Tepidisphaeraceae bacterium]
DRSLKAANALIRHRNVLTRAERLEKLKEQEKWNDSKSVYGLPKVAHRKLETGKAAKTDAAEGAAATGGAPAAAAAPAAGGKGAAGAKGAAPAAPAGGAKGAAPAAAKGGAPAAGKKK